MNGRRPHLVLWVLRVAASPTLLLAVACMIMFGATIDEMVELLGHGHRVRVELGRARAEVAAETALAQHAAEVGDEPYRVAVAGQQLTLDRAGDGFVVTCQDANQRHVFVCPELAGGGPAALGHRRAAREPQVLARLGGGLLLTDDRQPEFDAEAVARAPRVTLLLGFHGDQGIALQHFAAGTDGDDLVWVEANHGRATTLPGGLLVVPGHLWLPPGDRALVIELIEDVVVLVEGNLYLGRSLRVDGPGRLLLVTSAPSGSVLFADCDGSGGWSPGDRLHSGAAFAGPVEGVGNVYLGLPGRSAAVECDAGLVVAGELHACVDADVGGPLVLHHGLTDLGADRRPYQMGSGHWVYRPGRERIPGAVVSGRPRAGLLRRRDDR